MPCPTSTARMIDASACGRATLRPESKARAIVTTTMRIGPHEIWGIGASFPSRVGDFRSYLDHFSSGRMSRDSMDNLVREQSLEVIERLHPQVRTTVVRNAATTTVA